MNESKCARYFCAFRLLLSLSVFSHATSGLDKLNRFEVIGKITVSAVLRRVSPSVQNDTISVHLASD